MIEAGIPRIAILGFVALIMGVLLLDPLLLAVFVVAGSIVTLATLIQTRSLRPPKIDLELPEVKKAPQLEQKEPITLTVRPGLEDPEIEVDGESIELVGLVSRLNEMNSASPGRPIALEGDRRADWQQMAPVIAALKQGGFENVGIVTTPAS